MTGSRRRSIATSADAAPIRASWRRSRRRPVAERGRPAIEFEGPLYHFEVDRRDFLKTFGGGLVVLLIAPSVAGAQESGRGLGGDRMPSDVGAWLHVAEDGAITVFTGKTEIGQNIRTSLTQA